MKVLVGAFNQEKALVVAFSLIVKTGCGTDGTLHSTSSGPPVGDDGIAASVPGHDVHIVNLDIVDIIIDMSRYNGYYLVSPLHESNATVVLDVLHA